MAERDGGNSPMQSRLAALHAHRTELAIALGLFALLVLFAVFVRVGDAPLRRVGDDVDLASYGIEGVHLHMIYPTRLEPFSDGQIETVTVMARADDAAWDRAISVVLPLSDDSVAYVDGEGMRVPGRLEITPGYPEALPHELRVLHARTQLRGGLLGRHMVSVEPRVLVDGTWVAVPELSFRLALEAPWLRTMRRVASFLAGAGLPALLILAAMLVVVLAWGRLRQRRRLAQEQQLAGRYRQLREHVRLSEWGQARSELEDIRTVDAGYRDLPQLELMVNAAESRSWRLEQLYEAGWAAYKRRDWPEAIHALRAVEDEAPYYRNVAFLQRTAALYADLASRDRSRRLAAAQTLGQVGDLLDMMPLLYALGDPSEQVAEAASDSIEAIGLGAVDTLLAGLSLDAPQVRQRSYNLLRSFGQEAKASLVGALRSSDPRVTASAAKLLANLGALEALVYALGVVSEPHQSGIAEALLSEGLATCRPMVNALLSCPPEKRDLYVRLLVALRHREPVDRHLEELLRSTREARHKVLLKRVLAGEPEPFTADMGSAPRSHPPAIEATPGSAPATRRRLRRPPR